MATVVQQSNHRSLDLDYAIKGALDDFEALQEKKREAQDIQTLSATKGDPAALRDAMKNMRSKRGQTLALGQLGQVPTKLEEQEVENKKNMIDVYLGRTAAVGERQQAAVDRDTLSMPELEKVKPLIDQIFPDTSKFNFGWGKGPSVDAAESATRLQKLKDMVGYDQLGKAKQKQIDTLVLNRFNKLNNRKALSPRANNQFELPPGINPEVPNTDTPSSVPPELIPRLGNLSPERRKMVEDLLRSGVPKEKIIEAIDRDMGLR